MADIIKPANNGTAKVYTDGGNDYICVQGENAFDSDDNPYSNAAAGVYNDGNSPPDSFPGVGGTAPTVVETAVNDDGTFDFTLAATFVPGAAGTLRSPYPSNTVGVWFQDSSGVWTDTPITSTFGGKDASATDCGTGYGCGEAAADDDECDEHLVVEKPVSRNAAWVLMLDGVGYICVEGGNAFDDDQCTYPSVAAKIYGPGQAIPPIPPQGDADVRIVKVDGNQRFEIKSLPGAAATKGRPWPCNKLVLWPQYDDGTWGPLKHVVFYGRASSKWNDCNAPVPPPFPAPAVAPAPAPPCGCKGGEEKASPAADHKHAAPKSA